jgi:hypothetical protein
MYVHVNNLIIYQFHYNRIGFVMVTVLTSSAVESPGRVKPKTIKLVCVASPLSMQHQGEKAKTGWFGIRIMCPSGATCLSADCRFSELPL